MKPDKVKLAAKIDGMKAVCADGKREIRELVEELIGEKLVTSIKLHTGMVILNAQKDPRVLVSGYGSEHKELRLMDVDGGFVYSDEETYIQQNVDSGRFQIVAQSIREWKGQK